MFWSYTGSSFVDTRNVYKYVTNPTCKYNNNDNNNNDNDNNNDNNDNDNNNRQVKTWLTRHGVASLPISAAGRKTKTQILKPSW